MKVQGIRPILQIAVLALWISFSFSFPAQPAAAQQGITPDQPGRAPTVFIPMVTILNGSNSGSPGPIGGSNPSGPSYYVDSAGGSDNNPGTSESAPWKTLARVQAAQFSPGSTIYFKRGLTWTGILAVDDSGTEGNPITFTAYGSGEAPVIKGSGSASKGVTIDADWVVVDGLKVQDVSYLGVEIRPGADHNVIQNMEVTRAGIGIYLYGQHNRITGNYVHDMHMVNNTLGGTDDYGAVAIGMESSYNEISYNRLINCIASSYDFGVDGGAVEWFRNADNNYVHHNFASGNDGFLEVGGGSARDSVVSYNVSFNNRRFSSIQLSGAKGSLVENFRIENNTIVEPAADQKRWEIFAFDGVPSINTVILRNNIIDADWFNLIANQPGFTHDHNLYTLKGGTRLGFNLGPGELVADPLFVDSAGQDFHLLSGSLAIQSGVFIAAGFDFDNHPVTADHLPDLGAFEYQKP